MKKNIIVLFFIYILFIPLHARVVINEFMSSNADANLDYYGNASDWLEIYNDTPSSVTLTDYYLTDDPANLMKWRMPTLVLASHGYRVIWCSNRNIVAPNGEIHTSFAISAGGEQLSLVMPDGITIVDQIGPVSLGENFSYGRQPDGSDILWYFAVSTPATSNITTGYSSQVPDPVLSSASGLYQAGFSLTVTEADLDASLHYTTDGSEPTESSPIFPGTLSIHSMAGTPNNLSLIRTTLPNSTYEQDLWYPPLSEVFKGQVIRVKAYKTGAYPSNIVTGSYFVDSNILSRYQMPVVSLVSNYENWFGLDTGIMIAGSHYDGVNWDTANFAQEGTEWNKPVHFDFIDTNGSLAYSSDCEINIHGGGSQRMCVKSVNLKAKSGSFHYQFLPQKTLSTYDRLVLRSSGQDWKEITFRDVFMQQISKHLGFGYQEWRPVAVFINGEFWGKLNLRDKMDEYFVKNEYNMGLSEFDLLEHSEELVVDNGIDTDYLAMLDYMSTHSMATQSYYNYIGTQMDIDEFTKYYTSRIYNGNIDWPYNNCRFFRKKVIYTPNAPYGQDGRWHWLNYDCDDGFFLYNDATVNTLDDALVTTGWKAEFTRIPRYLLANTQYKYKFINCFADMLNTCYLPTRVVSVIHSCTTAVYPIMAEHINRWVLPTDMNEWNTWIDKAKAFAQDRPANLRNHIKTQFRLSGTYNLTLNVNSNSMGYFNINMTRLDSQTPGVASSPYPWTGVYFKSVPVAIKAKPYAGYQFVSWIEYPTVTSDSLNLNLSANTTVTAVFAPIVYGGDTMNPPAYLLSNGPYSMMSFADTTTAGTYPPYMRIQQTRVVDPGLSQEMTDPYTLAYNLTSKTRVLGLNGSGIGFINTGATDLWEPGASGRDLGAAVLGLDTWGVSNIKLLWRGGTVLPNTRVYKIRLQYRIGTTGSFSDVLFGGNPVEYTRNTVADHNQVFGPISLPTALENQPYVQLRWKYYWYSGTSSSRCELRIDDIIVWSGELPSPDSLSINEMMSSNATHLNPPYLDEDSAPSDWIEIYNASTTPANVTGYFLSDDPMNLQKWMFPPMTLAAHSFTVVWASDKDRQNPASQLHTNFKISQEGEILSITSRNGTTVMNQLPANLVPSDRSFGVMPDGSTSYSFFISPTPGSTNYFVLTTPINPAISDSLGVIHVHWDSVPFATQYKIYSQNMPNGEWTLRATIPAPQTEWIETDTSGRIYLYRIVSSTY
ncbi:MAG TPA: CotH kinase family protein [Candidatus Cloacimonadota bacterium]|nr:CotH kinase family protein [Candidatus Cloacimonadota bacterium]